MYVTTVTVSQARATLPELLDRVLAGEEITITRHGSPVAVVIRPERLRVRRADAVFRAADEVRQSLERTRAEPLRSGKGISARRAEQLVDDVRRSRRDR
jgi:prevent-host-death family protein